MADRHSRRKPGMTVGQRMRDFSRSVMRHYAPLPDDAATPPMPAPSAPAASNGSLQTDAADINTQYIASAPLPFDVPAAEQAAPLLPPAELPVYAPDPPLPQYVVPATPAPAVQRTEQPARPAGDIAVSPDGKPLMHNGKPIPIDNDPTPPALRELMRRDRERSAEVQRLKEERTEKLKAELPPAPEDPDAPRSSRIRRRGSADVDYIQTKALADKREPGDTAADPKANVKSPREPEKQETPTLDDDDDSIGAGIDSPPFEAPTDTASRVTDPSGISTASDSPAIQREIDAAAPTPFIPFDAPLAEPAVMPDVPQPQQPTAEPQSPAAADAPLAASPTIQRQPDTEVPAASLPLDVARDDHPASKPADRPMPQDITRPAAVPQASTPAVQRQADTDTSAPSLPFTETNAARDNARPSSLPSTPDVPEPQQAAPAQMPPQAVQRQAEPEITPSLPFDLPVDLPGVPNEAQIPVAPAPEIPAVQRELDSEIPSPSLPFAAPVIEQPDVQGSVPSLTDDAPSEAAQLAGTTQPLTLPALQRQPQADPPTPNLPFDTPSAEQIASPDAAQLPVSTAPDTPVPPVQRQIDGETISLPANEVSGRHATAPEADTPPAPETALPPRVTVPEPAQPTVDSASPVPSPVVQREPEVSAPAPDALPFDAPSIVEAAQPELPQPTQSAAQEVPAPIDMSPAGTAPVVQRQLEVDVPAQDALPFDTPTIEEAAQSELPQPLPAAAQEASASIDTPPAGATPVVQREPEVGAPAPDALPFDAPPVTSPEHLELAQPTQSAVQQTPAPIDTPPAGATPVVQRQPDVGTPAPDALPFDAQPVAQERQPAISQPQTDATPAQLPPVPAIQRQSSVDALAQDVLPFDVPAAEQSGIQPTVPPVAEISRPQQASVPQSPAPTSALQRDAVENSSSSLPAFDAPLPTQPEAADTPQDLRAAPPPSAPAPALQRQVEAESSAQRLPVDESQIKPAAVPDISSPEQAAPPTVTPSAASPAPVPTIQRQDEADHGAAPALPFDAQPVERFDTPQAQPTETLETSQPEQATMSPAPMPTAAPLTPEPVVQRQTETAALPLPFDMPVVNPTDMLDTPAGTQAVLPEILPQSVAPSAMTPPSSAPAVQRQQEGPASVPANAAASMMPSMLPFDDLDAAVVQRVPDQPAAQTPPPALPFDQVTSAESPELQRVPQTAPSDPFSTPGTMPAGVPAEGRMDVFQALVAAGMVSRPPGGSSMPDASPSQPLMQRSPSREAYLANMAQRQESAGVISGTVQRALSDEPVSNSSPEPSQDKNSDAPEINLDQLASDVMRVLRSKLRSEQERLSKR